MAKNKNNKAFWGTRIKKTSSLFQKIGNSIDVDKRLFNEDIKGSEAHVKMLSKQKIISKRIEKKILRGLKKIQNEISKKKFKFDRKYEDIHMNIENRLGQLIGDDAGYIHTGRSRNDQVITDFKLWIKSSSQDLDLKLSKLIKTILNLANKNIYTIMPGFTHLKNAQPVSLAHYLLAYIEMFQRDKKRFEKNLESLNENPLGVAALTGTSFNIDRNYTSKKLGFKKPTRNSIDTVSDRDFVLDFLYTSSVCSLHISRISEELIIWNSEGFNMIEMSDKIVTGSSIMPQKKNPDPLEFLRGKTGNSYGNLFSMLTILKGLPLSYFKDLQDDKEIVFRSYDSLSICIQLLDEVLKNIKPKKDKMISLAKKGFITSTDLADYLVKNYKLNFRIAYKITAKIVNYAEKNNKKLDQLSLGELKKFYPKVNNKIFKILTLENSINSKKSFGGTSFNNVKRMIKKYYRIYR
ncbi:MAG: argininosuccinate lyase [Candidatus Pelagibacter sp. TMED275]|nr:MAG: argininosuccinate lyase [Candidatus Pelagibacter sp. TMED275]